MQTAALSLLAAFIVSKLLRAFLRAVGRRSIHIDGFHPDWAGPTYTILRTLLIALSAVVVFHYLPGSDSRAFEGVALFVGFLVSTGSGSAIANAMAGAVLTYTRAFQVGDRVKIGDAYGDVVERSLLVTRVRTIKNEDISIPNSSVMGRSIINYSSSADRPGLILHTEVTLGYDVPWRDAHRLLTEAARATAHIVPSPEPFVYQLALEDFYVRYQLNAYTDQPNSQALIYSRLHENIQDVLHGAGIEILSPHYTAFRDGSGRVTPQPLPPGVETVPL